MPLKNVTFLMHRGIFRKAQKSCIKTLFYIVLKIFFFHENFPEIATTKNANYFHENVKFLLVNLKKKCKFWKSGKAIFVLSSVIFLYLKIPAVVHRLDKMSNHIAYGGEKKD